MIAILVLGALLALGLPAGAQEVAEEELRSADREIEFENYSGPYARIDTAEEIKAIGFLLAGSLKQDGRTGRFLTKYTILRAQDAREQGRFDADILSIEPEARVDHIDNVRRILAGYLEGAFAYSAADARLLARFATVYNAVYRGNLGYFGAQYKAVVMSHLSAVNAGISTRYYEWPGATRLLVPLTSEAGEGRLSSLSTTELTEEGVIEEMRREPDKGLEERKDMVELKEREIEEKQAGVEEAQKQLAEEKAELERKQAEAAAAETPEEKAQAQEEVARQEEEVKRAEAEVAAKQAEVAAKEAEVAKEREGVIADEKARELSAAGTGAAAAGPSPWPTSSTS
jgi:flagellar biosynthesis GTPase FlhF